MLVVKELGSAAHPVFFCEVNVSSDDAAETAAECSMTAHLISMAQQESGFETGMDHMHGHHNPFLGMEHDLLPDSPGGIIVVPPHVSHVHIAKCSVTAA